MIETIQGPQGVFDPGRVKGFGMFNKGGSDSGREGLSLSKGAYVRSSKLV